MRISGFEQSQGSRVRFCHQWRVWPFLALFLGPCAGILIAQDTTQDNLSQQILKLTDAMARTQAQLEQSQHQLTEMQKQLNALQEQVERSRSTVIAPAAPGSSSAPPTGIPAKILILHYRIFVIDKQCRSLK